MHLRFFVGGAEGDAFGTIVYNGAKQAAADTGAQVDYVFSGWELGEDDCSSSARRLASKPAGIAMMGHPGDVCDHAARRAGVEGRHQDDVPERAGAEVVAAFGGGYVGAQQEPQGRALGVEAVRLAGLKAGDTAIVLGPFDNENRGARERGTVAAMEEAGVKVVKINTPPSGEWAADPEPRHSGHHRRAPQQPGHQGGRLSGRADARQRADLHAGRRQEAPATSSTSASTPARRSSRRSRAAGCS